MKLNCKLVIIGIITGAINGLLGVGGGTFLIPALTMLKKVPQHLAHGTTITVIFPTAVLSSIIYGINQQIDYQISLQIVVSGAIGSYLGAKLMNRLNANLLKKLFAVFIIITGFRLVLT